MLVNGQFIISGGNYAVEPHAKVFCLNEANKILGQDDADSVGTYTISLPAEPGNKIACWQQVDYQVSEKTILVVQP